MKCSRRKAPMGTMPVMECKRRSRNEVPSPARKGATPGLIFGTGATGLAVDATMTAPYEVRCANRLLSVCVGREVKERTVVKLVWLSAEEEFAPAFLCWWRAGRPRPAGPFDCARAGSRDARRSTAMFPDTTPGTREKPRHGGCTALFLPRSVRQRSCRFAGNRTVDRIRIRGGLG